MLTHDDGATRLAPMDALRRRSSGPSSGPSSGVPDAAPVAEDRDIAAVVVTFNRCRLLTDLVHSLLQQSHRLQAIFIVDNASSDDTERDARALAAEHPAVVYIRCTTNTGGSGGFCTGVRGGARRGTPLVLA